jgi:hypothetical protein
MVGGIRPFEATPEARGTVIAAQAGIHGSRLEQCDPRARSALPEAKAGDSRLRGNDEGSRT